MPGLFSSARGDCRVRQVLEKIPAELITLDLDGSVGQVTEDNNNSPISPSVGVELAGKSLNACLYVAHSVFLSDVNGESLLCVQSDSVNLRFLSNLNKKFTSILCIS